MYYFVTWIDKYTDWVIPFVRSQSVLAPLLLILIEELGIPIFLPGDVILAYTGYNVSRSDSSNVIVAIIVAMISIAIGSSLLFLAARRWGNLIVTKLGRFLFIKESHIKRAEQLFARYGVWTIIVGRHIPGMRVPITLFAAISGIRFMTFFLSTMFSAIFWVMLYLNIGARFGAHIQHVMARYIGLTITIIVAAIILIIVLHIWGSWRERRKNSKKP